MYKKGEMTIPQDRHNKELLGRFLGIVLLGKPLLLLKEQLAFVSRQLDTSKENVETLNDKRKKILQMKKVLLPHIIATTASALVQYYQYKDEKNHWISMRPLTNPCLH